GAPRLVRGAEGGRRKTSRSPGAGFRAGINRSHPPLLDTTCRRSRPREQCAPAGQPVAVPPIGLTACRLLQQARATAFRRLPPAAVAAPDRDWSCRPRWGRRRLSVVLRESESTAKTDSWKRESPAERGSLQESLPRVARGSNQHTVVSLRCAAFQAAATSTPTSL